MIQSTHGIVRPEVGFSRFQLQRHEPDPALAWCIVRYWVVSWELPPGESFTQEILPLPNVNLGIEATRAAIHGIATRRFAAPLTGQGRVVGVKFCPAGFAPFYARPLTALTERVAPIGTVFGPAGESLAREVRALDDSAARARLDAFFLARAPRPEAEVLRVNELVEHARTERSLCRAEQLAARAGLSLRSLQRLFSRYLGVGPKWVIQRARVQEAAERVARGASVDWAGLAAELGYHDQSHLIRDFKAHLGETPRAYAARCLPTLTPREGVSS